MPYPTKPSCSSEGQLKTTNYQRLKKFVSTPVLQQMTGSFFQLKKKRDAREESKNIREQKAQNKNNYIEYSYILDMIHNIF